MKIFFANSLIKTMFFIVIILLTNGCVKNKKKETNLSLSAQDVLSKVRDFNELFELEKKIIFKSSDSLNLSIPRKILINNSNEIIWAQSRPPMFVFDWNGNKIQTIGRQGSGPGEFRVIGDVGFDSTGCLFVSDWGLRKISIFSNYYKYLNSYQYKRFFRKMCVDNSGNLYALSEELGGKTSPAVTKYGNIGNNISEWGNVPLLSEIQDVLPGGGITTDAKNIYYCYISDHKIWKTSFDGNDEVVFDDKPSYYKGSTKKRVVTGLIKEAMNMSRIIGIYYLDIGIILQQIEDGLYKKGEKVKYHLEVWDANGNKFASGIECPGVIVTSHNNKIGILEKDWLVESDPILKIYKLKETVN